MKRAVRYYVNDSRPDLQPISTTNAPTSECEALERDGWREVGREVYKLRVEAWRRWRTWNQKDGPKGAA